MPYTELDSLYHGPNWEPADPDVFRARVAELVARDGWVIDGGYRGVLGDLVLGSADVVVWLDLPLRVWVPRLVRRSMRRARTREELWNGNVETWRSGAGLLAWAVRAHFRRRRAYPSDLGRFPLVRIRSTSGVRRFLDGYGETR